MNVKKARCITRQSEFVKFIETKYKMYLAISKKIMSTSTKSIRQMMSNTFSKLKQALKAAQRYLTCLTCNIKTSSQIIVAPDNFSKWLNSYLVF